MYTESECAPHGVYVLKLGKAVDVVVDVTFGTTSVVSVVVNVLSTVDPPDPDNEVVTTTVSVVGTGEGVALALPLELPFEVAVTDPLSLPLAVDVSVPTVGTVSDAARSCRSQANASAWMQGTIVSTPIRASRSATGVITAWVAWLLPPSRP